MGFSLNDRHCNGDCIYSAQSRERKATKSGDLANYFPRGLDLMNCELSSRVSLLIKLIGGSKYFQM